MFNKIANKVKGDKIRAEVKRLEEIVAQIVDILTENNVNIDEMAVILKTMNDGYMKLKEKV